MIRTLSLRFPALAGGRWLALSTLVLVALVVLVLSLVNPFAADSWLPPCLFHALTGLYCPGCGTTRALHALLHGDPLQALRMNSLAVIAVPLLPLLYWQQRRPQIRWLAQVTDARFWLASVLAFAILRNLPLIPFAWLAPG